MVLAHPGSPGQRAIERVCVCVCVCLLIGLSVCYSIQSLYQHVDAQGMYYMGPGYPMERGHFWGEEDILGHAHG